MLTPEEVAELGLADEAELSRRAGLEFRILPIPDLGVPPSLSAMGELVEILERSLASGRIVGIHCRQSIGRSSLVAASVLTSAGMSPEEAFKDISAARGTPVPETAEQRRWVERFAETAARVPKVA